MAEQESTYWWHRGRLRIIEAYLNVLSKRNGTMKILNVGCGTGGTLPLLERYGTVDNVDVSDEAISYMRRAGYMRVTKVRDTKLPFGSESYDLVVAFDVLEHIKEDGAALAEWSRVLKAGGAVLLTVPAYAWLWTQHDELLMHHRRYSGKLLKAGLQRAGLRIERISYCFFAFLPLIVGFRLLQKLFGRRVTAKATYVGVPGFLNSFFIAVIALEAKLHGRVSLPAGSSLVALARK